jgi:hypothetical protein
MLELIPRDDGGDVFMHFKKTPDPDATDWTRTKISALMRREDGTWFLSQHHLEANLTPLAEPASALRIVLQSRAYKIAQLLTGERDG